jgi:Ca-activated chloride channel family protein
LVGVYFYALRRNKRVVLRYTSIGLVKEALDGKLSLRRHIPPALLLLAVTVAFAAAARPSAMIALPSERSLVVLAMDVSVSMRAADVKPDRFTAAKNAAKTFIQEMTRTTQIGLVAFAGNAMLVQEPTLDRQALVDGVERLHLQRATNIGGAILTSLQVIFPTVDFIASLPENEQGWRRRSGASLDDAPVGEPAVNLPPVPPGSFDSTVIILLTDGQATTGPDPIAVARLAADRGVRVFTVGLGSAGGEIIGWGGRTMRVQIDEASLKAIADLTRGKYYFADSNTVLTDIYQQLNTQLVMERKPTEISFLFAAVAALLAIAAGGLSLVWFGRPY